MEATCLVAVEGALPLLCEGGHLPPSDSDCAQTVESNLYCQWWHTCRLLMGNRKDWGGTSHSLPLPLLTSITSIIQWVGGWVEWSVEWPGVGSWGLLEGERPLQTSPSLFGLCPGMCHAMRENALFKTEGEHLMHTRGNLSCCTSGKRGWAVALPQNRQYFLLSCTLPDNLVFLFLISGQWPCMACDMALQEA